MPDGSLTGPAVGMRTTASANVGWVYQGGTMYWVYNSVNPILGLDGTGLSALNGLKLKWNDTNGRSITFRANLNASYNEVWPANAPLAGQAMEDDGSGNLSWTTEMHETTTNTGITNKTFSGNTNQADSWSFPASSTPSIQSGFTTLFTSPTLGLLRIVPQGSSVSNALRVATVAIEQNSARVVATTNQTLSNDGVVIDGVTVNQADAPNNVVLLTGQTNGWENGYWYVISGGAWLRPAWGNVPDDYYTGLTVPIREGTLHANSVWHQTSANATVLNSGTITFVEDKTSNLSKIQAKTAVYIDAINYPTIASAVTYAESLTAAGTAPGVVINVPPGQYAEAITIHKNVSLMGAGVTNTRIDSLTIRPTSISVAPAVINISNIAINNAAGTGFLTVDNQTTAVSGIYNLSMLGGGTSDLPGLTLNNVSVGVVTVNNIANLNLLNVVTTAATFTLLNVNVAEITGGFINSAIAINGNDAGTGAAGTATTVFCDSCVMIDSIAVTKVGGTNNPRFVSTNGELAAVTIGANTDVEVTGGTTGGKSGSAATTWNSTAPYTPAVSTNWSAQPTSVDAALDNLATHISPVGFTVATTVAQPTCASGIRGQIWVTQGGTGVADIIQYCKHLATNAYAWSTFTTAP
jgi:hypothetical protein